MSRVSDAYGHLSSIQSHHSGFPVEFFDKNLWPLRQFFPWWHTVHGNPIWHHRFVIAVADCLQDPNDLRGELDALSRRLRRQWSTGPLVSNKSLTYWAARVCIETRLEDRRRERSLKKLIRQLQTLSPDGCYREGAHYGAFVSDPLKRALWHITDDPLIADDDILLLAKLVGDLEAWLQAISIPAERAPEAPSQRKLAVIGDGWPEWIMDDGGDDLQVAHYRDMSVLVGGGWKVIHNHRRTGPTLHEHCEGNGIVAAHHGKWVLPGDGEPSYAQKLLHFWRWYRPRNHWKREHWTDLPLLWRLLDITRDRRQVMLKDSVLHVTDAPTTGTIRWPGVAAHVKITPKAFPRGGEAIWMFDGYRFRVRSHAAEDIRIRSGKAYVATGYKKWNIVPVVRVTGWGLTTIIEPLAGRQI